MRGREFPSASWQILSWITMEYYAMLLSMNEGRPCHRSVNKRVKWLGALAVLLFLLGTGLFSFLWNVPLNTLRPAHAIAAPSAILVRENSSPERCRMALEPSFLASIQPFLKHYVETVTNAGRLDFSSHVPQEVEIRMEGPFSGRFQLPNQIRIQHADKQKTGCLRPGYLPVAEKQDEDGKTGKIRKYGHRYRTE